jgi:ABC-type nitrate/sulfonate/bicarbonate transport system substrate-binding protein
MLRLVRTALFTLIMLVITVTSYAQDQLDLVRVIVGPQLSQSHMFIADAEGYFADQNIDLELVFTPRVSDASSYALVLTGEVEAIQGAWTPAIFNAISRGETFKAVATSAYNAAGHCPFGALVVDEGQAENFDIESLRGAHVTMTAGMQMFYFDQFLDDYGLSTDDVTFEEIPQEARGQAVMNNSVALAWLNEPALSRLVNANEVDVLAGAQEILPDGSQGALLFGPSMLNRDDDLPVRF